MPSFLDDNPDAQSAELDRREIQIRELNELSKGVQCLECGLMNTFGFVNCIQCGKQLVDNPLDDVQMKNEIFSKLKMIGFSDVEINPNGYVSGNLNVILEN